MYLVSILKKYSSQDMANYFWEIQKLKKRLIQWAGYYFVGILESGSQAKGTAVSISSDVDYMVSLSSENLLGYVTLEDAYNSLYSELRKYYSGVRRQNVSIRIDLPGLSLLSNPLKVDITPARKRSGHKNDHSLYVSKEKSWKKTNIQKHISDVKNSQRNNEIKLLKIWRELNRLDFPSIYLEYLIVDFILYGKPIGLNYLESNFIYLLNELSKTNDNPLLTARVIDPANSENILSDLLTQSEKDLIRKAATQSLRENLIERILW